MTSRPGYHHGALRASLVAAAAEAIEARGPDALSLRDLAQSLGVSTAAPYRHFPDRRALLAEVAAQGFGDLNAAYEQARLTGPTPAAALRGTARAYLSLAFARPGLFRLMFGSDIVGPGAPGALLKAAGEAWESLRRAVQAADPDAAPDVVTRNTIAGWSTLHGFITLRQSGRLRDFMTAPLSDADLLDAILDRALGG